MNYLMVLPVRFYRVDEGRIATESAFAEHVRVLREMLAPHFSRLTVAAPIMSREEYERNKSHLGHINEAVEGISLVELFPAESRGLTYWLRDLLPMILKLRRAVGRADVVHGATSHDLFRPFEFPLLLLALLARKPTISMADTDFRNDAKMNYTTGRWSRMSYLLCKYIYDPIRNWQLRFSVKRCSLVMFKSKQMCDDFGRDRPHVKNFLDSAYSGEQIILQDSLERKVEELSNMQGPLELVYFGRLVGYKGIDRCIDAIALLKERGHDDVRFHVIGSGEDEKALKQHAENLQVADRIVFHGAVPFGPELFERLYDCHLLLAAPLSEDTPRSALDALASGLPILAFDTYYYRDLAASGAVQLVRWPSVKELADKIDHYRRDRKALAPMMRKAVAFARDNTQEIWLQRRIDWILELVPQPAGSRLEQT